MSEFEPSVPTPDVTTLVAALVRHLLTIGATLGIVHGVYSDSAVTTVAGALVAIGMICWSLYQKVSAKRADNAGSVESAKRTIAVQPA